MKTKYQVREYNGVTNAIGRRFVAVAIAFIVLFSLFPSAAFASNETATYVDGVYDGIGVGRNGSISVKTTIQDGNISNIDVASHSETAEYWAVAVTTMISRILSAQSTDVDAVTGATLSSNGIKQAVAQSLSNAVDNGETSYTELLPGNVYSVPVRVFAGNGQFENLAGFETSAHNIISPISIVRPKDDGTFDVTLRLGAYALLQFLQMVDPEQVADIKETYSTFGDIKGGTFNVQEPLKTNFITKGIIADEANSFYLSEEKVRIEIADDTFDTANVSFNVSTLGEDVFFTTSCTPSDISTTILQRQIIRFDLINALQLPDNLTYQEDSITLGFAWSEYFQRTLSSTMWRDYQPEVLAYLNTIFEKDVNVAVDETGKMLATFTLSDTVKNSENSVLKIEVTTGRIKPYNYKLASTLRAEAFSEYYNSTYETIYDSETDGNTVQLTFDELVFGRSIRITTDETVALNVGKSATASQYVFGNLRIEPLAEDDGTAFFTAADADTGVTLRAGDNSVPLTSVFAVEKEAKYYNAGSENSNESFRAFAKGSEYIREYTFSLTNNDIEIVPINPVTIEIPIPSGWNIETISAYTHSRTASGFEADLVSTMGTLDKDKRVLRITTNLSARINASYIIVDRGSPIDLESENLSDGLYKVGVSLAHSGIPQKPSMATAAIANHTGYLEVVGGAKTLYLELHSVTVMTLRGYLYKIFTYDADLEKIVPSPVTPYSYFTADDGKLFTEWGAEWGNLDLYYMKHLSIPIDGIYKSENGYYVSMIIPMMDSISVNPDGSSGVPGDGVAEKTAFLFINSYEKLESNTENPYAGYDKNVILAEILNASKLTDLSNAGKAILTPAIATAQAAYDENPTTDEAILSARDALRTAMAAAKSAVDPAGNNEVLTALIVTANGKIETAYTATSYVALQTAITHAQAVADNEDATQNEIDAQVTALTDAINALVARANTTALSALIVTAKEVDESKYTALSYGNLQTAINAAKSVADDADATQTEVNAAMTALQTALDNLIEKADVPTADTSALEAAIATAKSVQATDYENTSYAALTAAITAAESSLEIEGLTQTQANDLTASLNAAKVALVSSNALVSRVKTEVSLSGKTALKNYGMPNQDSMGNAAIDHSKSKIVINADGNAELRLFFRPLEFTGLTGYLQSLSKVTKLNYDNQGFIDSYETAPATVYSTYEGITDAFGPTIEGLWYPKDLGIPVTIGDTNDIIVEVYVPVMGSSATQLARLRIDWTDFEPEDTSRADVTELEAAINGIPDGMPPAYIGKSYEALTASVAAGTYLIDSNEALSVTDELVHNRTAAILAAQSALIDPDSTVVKSELYALYQSGAALDSGAYTTTSYNALLTAIDHARGVLQDAYATQDAVDSEVNALQAAINALVYRADVTALTALISTAKTDYKAADYTSSSYAELLTAIAAAEAVRDDDGDATQELVDAEVEALKTAIDALVENKPVEVKPDVTTNDSGAATATVDEPSINTALAVLKDDDSGLTSADTLTIVVPVSTTESTDDKILLTLSNDAATALAAAARNDETANIVLIVESDVANITLDNAAIIAAFGNVAEGEDVVITIESASKTELNAVQETAIAGKTAITVEFTSGGEKVHVSGITVTAPYSAAADASLKVWRLKADGTLELADNAPKFEDGNIIFTVTQ